MSGTRTGTWPSLGNPPVNLEYELNAVSEMHDVVYPQSAAIPYRIEENTPLILLITSRRRKHWIVPKGIVETWQTPSEAALEEAFEEAGVRGTLVDDAIGLYEYKKRGDTHRVHVFLMRVEEVCADWPESYFREREWVNVDEALELIKNPGLCRLIRQASNRME